MATLEDRLTAELDRIGDPGDPTGVVQAVLRRARRRRTIQRAGTIGLVVLVLVGTLAGVYGLTRVFPRTGSVSPGGGRPPAPATQRPPALTGPPTGLRLVFSQVTGDGALVSIRPDGSGRRTIPTPAGWPFPAWSPDGRRLAVTVSSVGRDSAVWVMDPDGSHPHRIASARNVSPPSWSPDGSRVVYSANSAGRSTIHVVDADGTNDRVLYEIALSGSGAVFSAVLSPDGTKILFDQGDENAFDLFVMGADGSNVRRLTTTGRAYDPDWSPDGARIVFTGQEGNNESDIFRADADGSNVRRLTHGGPGATNLDPHWSPDGARIAYVAGVNGTPGGLVAMHADGSHPVTLVPRDVAAVSWQPLRR